MRLRLMRHGVWLRPGRASLAAALASLIAAASAKPADAAGAPPLSCPARLDVHARRATNAGAWAVGILPGHRRPRDGRHALSNISLAEGPPEQEAFLAPDDSSNSEGGLVNRWVLAPSERGYWLVCEYADAGANLNLRLGPEIGQCAIRYDAKAHVLTDGRAVDCRPRP